MREVQTVADGHTVSNAPDLFRPPKVKRHRARLVLGWGTAWEDLRVLSAFSWAERVLAAAHPVLELQEASTPK